MKYDKKEPETMDADPMRLLVSAILAFTVMLFINGFRNSDTMFLEEFSSIALITANANEVQR